jgi:hypothetical protein
MDELGIMWKNAVVAYFNDIIRAFKLRDWVKP